MYTLRRAGIFIRLRGNTPTSSSGSGALSANAGRLDGQVRAARAPSGGADERFLVERLVVERLRVLEGPRVGRRDPHHAGEVGQRHAALEGARLSGEQSTRVLNFSPAVATLPLFNECSTRIISGIRPACEKSVPGGLSLFLCARERA